MGDIVDVFELNRNLNDKLLALNYSREFTTRYKCPPINSMYFCKGHNAAQQFFAFISLASYLVNRLSDTELKVDSFDDPNLTIDKLLNASQALVDVGELVSVRAKLKLGHGPEVLTFLTRLVDKLFEDESASRGDAVEIKYYTADGHELGDDEIDAEEEDENVIEDGDGDNEIELEEEFADYVVIDGDEFEDSLFGDEFVEPMSSMLEANTDLTEWKLELERALPQLNARILGAQMLRNGGVGGASNYDNEWRLHYRAATAQNESIRTNYERTKSLIVTLTGDIRSSLEKIDAKEAYLRENASTIIAEWQNVRDKADHLRQNYESIESETRDKHERLQQLTDEDRALKTAIEEYSLKVTDSSPLIDAKKGLRDLKQDLTGINIQIGVAIQTLVRHLFLAGDYF